MPKPTKKWKEKVFLCLYGPLPPLPWASKLPERESLWSTFFSLSVDLLPSFELELASVLDALPVVEVISTKEASQAIKKEEINLAEE